MMRKVIIVLIKYVFTVHRMACIHKSNILY